MKTRNLGLENFGRKYVKIFKKCLQFNYFYYLCNPLIEDSYAQPADTQLVDYITKFY